MIESRGQPVADSVRTPEPAAVRAVTFGAMLLGAEITLPSIIFSLWSSQLILDIRFVGESILLLGVGVVFGAAILARTLRSMGFASSAVVMSGLCIALSLVAVSETYSPIIVLSSMLGLGIGIGLLLGSQSPLFVSVITQAETVAGLLGFAWALGAIFVSVFTWVLFRVLPLTSLMLSLASLLLLAGLLPWLTPPPRRPLIKVRTVSWRFFLAPKWILVVAAVGLLGGAHGTTANLSAIYVSGKMGSGLHLAAAVPILYWLSIVTALLAGQRIAPLEERPSRMVVGVCVCIIGCVFLLQANEPSGIVAGIIAFGAGMGLFLALVSTWINQQMRTEQGSLLGPLLLVFVLGGLTTAWLAVRLVVVFGTQAVVWTASMAVILSMLAVVVLIIENRLAQTG